MRSFVIITTIGLAILGCQNPPADTKTATATEAKAIFASYDPNQFNGYWYAGKAEISSYNYTINRYGEDRNGYAVCVFVTEDFSKNKQVKLDDPAKAETDRVPVLKLNAMQRFQTGIYDYSMMSSLFTPIDIAKMPRSLKLTTTVQDWCGHVFTQMNLKENKYMVNQFSYFETEGDRAFPTEGVMLEDEIFTRLRINPESLPKGETKVIPNLTYTRLRHKDIIGQKAQCTTSDGGNGIKIFTVNYPDIKRKLEIRYTAAFPYKIMGWTEYDGSNKLSEATISKTVLSDYWMRNGKEFDYMRKDLGL